MEDVDQTVQDYYQALRNGAPLWPFFADEPSSVKIGISERLVGFDAIQPGIQKQTEQTREWVVTSTELSVTSRGCHAWMSDEVRLAWTEIETDTRRSFWTRWTGTLEARDEWQFVILHVSAGRLLD